MEILATMHDESVNSIAGRMFQSAKTSIELTHD